MMPTPARRVANLVRTSVLQSGRYGMLRLDKNERCTGYPTRTLRAMLRGLTGHHLTAYPEPGALYEKIGKWHGVGTEQVAVTAGSELAIRYLFEAFLEQGDEVVLLNPSFAMFEVYALLCGARLRPVGFDRRFRVEPEAILGRIGRQTKIVALANPNNPTGTVLDEPALLAILDRAKRHRALVLVDEAYYHFYKRTMLHHLPHYDNLVITRTFSKACGSAGVRLGYAIAHPKVIDAFNKIQPIDHVNVFAIKVGEYLIDHEDLIEQYVRQVEAGKRFLLREFVRLGLPAIGSHANFVLVDLGREKKIIIQSLYNRGIRVGSMLRLPFSSNFVRITAGPVSIMRRFVAALNAVLEEGHGSGRA